jgi:hypothetical protein
MKREFFGVSCGEFQARQGGQLIEAGVEIHGDAIEPMRRGAEGR